MGIMFIGYMGWLSHRDGYYSIIIGMIIIHRKCDDFYHPWLKYPQFGHISMGKFRRLMTPQMVKFSVFFYECPKFFRYQYIRTKPQNISPKYGAQWIWDMGYMGCISIFTPHGQHADCSCPQHRSPDGMRRAAELSLKIDAGVYGAAGAIFHPKKRWEYRLEKLT